MYGTHNKSSILFALKKKQNTKQKKNNPHAQFHVVASQCVTVTSIQAKRSDFRLADSCCLFKSNAIDL